MGFVRGRARRENSDQAASRQHRRLAACAAALCLVVAGSAPAKADTPPSPMVALGDSITRGFNACGWYVGCTARSFSTGSSASVGSHYRRILAENSAIAGHAYNFAITGAKASALPLQLSRVTQPVDYFTVLIGANDACTPTEAGMTSVADYQSQIEAALATIQAGHPDAKIALISIPDVLRLWEVGHVDVRALAAWSALSTCQSLLYRAWSSASADKARRARVQQRVIDYNEVLEAECAEYGPNCDFDDNAVFGYRFRLSQLSPWDYFHPSSTGQAELADLTYEAGFNW